MNDEELDRIQKRILDEMAAWGVKNEIGRVDMGEENRKAIARELERQGWTGVETRIEGDSIVATGLRPPPPGVEITVRIT